MAKLRRILLMAITLLCAVGLTACGKQAKQAEPARHPNQIKVVAATNIYGQMAEAVVGKYGKVTSLVNSGVDPHEFEPSIQAAHQVSDANVIIQNGLGYDDWMQKLTQNASSRTTQINVGQLLHKHNGDNEHLWYNPETAPAVVQRLVKVASQLQPEHRQTFEKNGQAYLERLKPVNELAKTSRSNLQEHDLKRKVDVSEPVFDEALHAMGYQVNNRDFENATEKEVDPSPATIKAMRRDLTEQRVAFFVDNTQTDSQTVNQMVKLAEQHHVPVVKVTETIPKGQNYVDCLTKTYQAVLKVQEQEIEAK
ncbi:zinc ABC transporter substrate-binding protein [Fructilactobacillus ixorae]|uniref:Zinc ABC transporter substrate-binding protein n=1 Tax=Fructilactobacillus ixorae TaxID=1750535 RepID=A0ABY5C6S1_9LACO|nr:zinc ABC transporter substrate-binding protein [Fructilactobacillus ixorae]USS93055.1 zinc ABC transporter substrate-binding protein [Fructilactobacillus ixorae]